MSEHIVEIKKKVAEHLGDDIKRIVRGVLVIELSNLRVPYIDGLICPILLQKISEIDKNVKREVVEIIVISLMENEIKQLVTEIFSQEEAPA